VAWGLGGVSLIDQSKRLNNINYKNSEYRNKVGGVLWKN